MLKDITLGQFFPGSSLLHKADPRMKIVLAIAYIIFVFLAKNTAAYVLAVGFTVLLVIISRINLSVVMKGLKPLLFIMIFTAFFNIFPIRVLWLVAALNMVRACVAQHGSAARPSLWRMSRSSLVTSLVPRCRAVRL